MNSIVLPHPVEKIINDPRLRKEVVQKSHLYFFGIYLHHYITYPMADFHHEFFRITENEDIQTAVLLAFRGSGKSTILTLSYPIWSIIGLQKKKFVLILSQTQEQAQQHFKNLKTELSDNTLLKKDLGPFREDNDWNANSVFIPKYNARITIASTEQSIRGIRSGSHRPDIILCDDVEDLNSAKTKEGRKKTYNWFTGEILHLGDKHTKVIVVGNLVHPDSLIMRLKEEIKNKERSGIFRRYPLVDDGKILWPEKFPTMEAIEIERLKIGDKFAFSREIMLKIIDDHEAVILKDYLHYYKTLPPELKNEHIEYAIGIDPAISQKDTADFTAMVYCKIVGYGNKRRIYILPNPINKKLRFPEMIATTKKLADSLGLSNRTSIYIEDVGFQRSLPQQLQSENFKAEGVKIGGMDKRERLIMTTNFIRSGKILFPEKGAELLIDQLLNFGVEKYDDLVDAFTILVLKLIEDDKKKSQTPVMMIDKAGFYDRGKKTNRIQRFLDED